MENNKTAEHLYKFTPINEVNLNKLTDREFYLVITNGDTCGVSQQKQLRFDIDHRVFLNERVQVYKKEDLTHILLPVQPLSNPEVVTDERINEILEQFLLDYKSRDIPSHIFFPKAIKSVRSLLQPQPVNSEGKKESHDSVFPAELRVVNGKVYDNSTGKLIYPTVEQGEAKEPTEEQEVENGFEKWLRERIEYKTTVPSEEVEIMRKAIIQCRSAYQSFRNKEVCIVFDKLKKHHKQLGIYLASEDISHHDFGELSERILPNLYDTLSFLFRSSEVKEQEITVEMIKKEALIEYPVKLVNSMSKTGIKRSDLNEGKRIAFHNGGQFVRSLQVKSNEQTKTL